MNTLDKLTRALAQAEERINAAAARITEACRKGGRMDREAAECAHVNATADARAIRRTMALVQSVTE